MKKKLIIFLSILLCAPFFFFGKNANAYSIVEEPICGLAINTATCSSLNDYKTYDKVYTNEFLNNIKMYESDLSFHKVGKVEAITKQEFSTKTSALLSSSLNVDQENSFQFFLESKTNFIRNTQNYYNKYYALYYECQETKKYSLINDDSEESSLNNINNMSIKFKTWLDQLSNGKISYSDFFDCFGTHIVTSVIYGGVFTYTNAIYSNISTSHEQFETEMSNYFNVNDNFAIGSNQKADQYNTYFSNTSYTKIVENYDTIGGEQYIHNISNNQNAWNEISNWCSTVKNNPQPISYGSSGLKGMWEILPESYSYLREKMKNEYESYCESKKILNEDSFNYKSSVSGQKNYGNIKDGNNITDDDSVYVYDTLSGLTNIEYNYLKNYNSFRVVANFTIYSIDKGWDWIEVYVKYNGKNSKIYYYKHDSDIKNHLYEDCSFSFDISINQISEDSLMLEFGAYGGGDDDWQCKDFTLTYYLDV